AALQARDGRLRVGCAVAPDAPRAEVLLEQRARRVAVVDDEDAPPGERRRLTRVPPARRAACEARGEPERAAAARLALDTDVAAHERDELLRDREPEPRPAEPARRRLIALRERGEDPLALLGGDADPRIRDVEAHR